MNTEIIMWNERRRQEFTAYASLGLLPGRVVGEHRSHYQVVTEEGELSATATGRIRNAARERSELPGVGDFVAVHPAQGDSFATIDAVLPRTSALVRKASGARNPQLLAANIDVAFIVTVVDGDFNLARIERYLALVSESGAAPVIILNKSDLTHDVNSPMAQIAQIAPGVPVHLISARDPDTIQQITRYFNDNRTIVLIGSSGVGKSTLTNQLLGRVAQATQEVRAHDSRGRHTTTHRQLYTRPEGGCLIDTPGLRGLELWNPRTAIKTDSENIDALAKKCRFRDCQHQLEPGCAVRAAVERGELDADRYANYVTNARAPTNDRPGGHRRKL